MIKVSVCYSSRSGGEFASCTIADLELHAGILENGDVFRAAVQTAYDRCVDVVQTQLRGQPDASPAPDPVAVVAAAAPSPPRPAAVAPAPPVVPLVPPTNGRTYYGNGSSAAPKTGKQLYAFAKDNGCVPWFNALGKKQAVPLPKLLSEWTDEWAVWAHEQYQGVFAYPPEKVYSRHDPVVTDGAEGVSPR
jgi:hypothetical protein